MFLWEFWTSEVSNDYPFLISSDEGIFYFNLECSVWIALRKLEFSKISVNKNQPPYWISAFRHYLLNYYLIQKRIR